MTHYDPNQASLLDLLFANRNKQYGAYMLRKYYPNRLSTALAISLSTVFLLLLLTQTLFHSKDAAGPLLPDGGVVIQLAPDLHPPKTPDPLPAPHPRAKAQVSTETFTTHIQLVQNDVTNMPKVTDLATRVIGTRTIDIPNGGGDPGPLPQPGSGSVPAPTKPVEPETPAFVDHPSVMPEYPGGMSAFFKYLGNQLVAPGDMASGEKRSVLVRFWVAEDGTVTRFDILQSGGSSFDNEVLRVLRRMPRWKPARQNGRAVATAFAQPVTFQAPEE